MDQYKALVAKLEAIQNRVEESVQPVEECGDMIAGHSGQQDSVTMNVSMNGSGAGGIRDLMAILKNIEDGGEPAHHDMIVGVDEPEMEEEIDGGFQSATTKPEPETAGINAVTPTGNDLASKGDEAPKANGGGNPFVREGLLNHLSNLYKEVKERDINVEEGFAYGLGGIAGAAVQGVKNAVSDVQQGYQQQTTPGAQPNPLPLRPEIKQQMAKISQQVASGAMTQDQAIAAVQQILAKGGLSQSQISQATQNVTKPAPVSPKAAAGFKDSDW